MKVCVDPGHGMSNRRLNVFDPGAVHFENGRNFQEAAIVLHYGLTLKDMFRARGVPVFMTRDDNEDHAPVGQRAGGAKSAGCDVLISLHMNDVDDDRANGTETLFKDGADKALAAKLQAAMIGITGLKDRGLKPRDDLAVLRFNGVAVLLELGFIANDKDRNKLIDPQTRDAICAAVAQVTIDHMA
jgi:N-acetylmuramoyl-L-alanine amidase